MTEPDNAPMMTQNNMSMMQDNASIKANCIPQETVIKNVKLAHAYVPFQVLCNTFSPMEALKKGTAFPPLLDVYGWERNKMGDSDDE